MTPHINVFVTKSFNFRARIKETDNSAPYEVTIGGENWKNGKGRAYEKEIKHKCVLLIETLNSRLSHFS